jgi:tetratricopeptide (TPR) repeat protein
MAIDKAKTQKAAEKYVASGKVPQAIEEYLKILKENPKDWNLMIQIGDLYLKTTKNSEAIGMFQKVADHYYTDGFFLKAIAIYKRINKLDPTVIEICIRLSDLYLKQGLTMDAKSQLQTVAAHYVSKNQTKDAIQTFRRLIEIEPDNLKTRNELAKAYKSEGMIPEAMKEYLEISDELIRKGMLKEGLAVLETAYKLDPKNIGIVRKILLIYNEQNDVAKGVTLLEDTLKFDVSNPEILAMLAESYAARKMFARAYETIDRALLHATVKEPLWSLKGDVYLKEGELDKAFAQYSLVTERAVQHREPEKAIALMQKVQRVDPSFPPVLKQLVELYTMAHQETNMLAAYNALIDAYISKAMYTDAAKYLEQLIQIEPDNAQHHEKLGFVKSFLEKPKPKEKEPPPGEEFSFETEVSGSEITSGDFDLGISLETEPGVSFFEPAPTPAPPPPTPVAPAPPPPKPAMAPAPAAIEATEEEKDFVSEHLIEAEVFTKYGLIDKAIEQLQIIVAKYPNSVLAHQKLKEIYLEKGERDKAVEECVAMSRIFRKQGNQDQAEDLLSEARQINPNHPVLDVAYKEVPAASTDVFGEIEKLAQSMKTRPGPRTQPKPAPPQKAAPPPPPVEEVEIEIEEPAEALDAGLPAEAFEEIDFYIGQGLSSEAKKMLHSMRQQHGDDPGILTRLARLGERVAAAPKPPAPVIEKKEPVPEPVEEEISINFEEEIEVPSFEAAPEAIPSVPEVISVELESEEIQIPALEEPPVSVEETWDFGKVAIHEEKMPAMEQSVIEEPEAEPEPEPVVEQPVQEPVVAEQEASEELSFALDLAPEEAEIEPQEEMMTATEPVEELELELPELAAEEEEPEIEFSMAEEVSEAPPELAELEPLEVPEISVLLGEPVEEIPVEPEPAEELSLELPQEEPSVVEVEEMEPAPSFDEIIGGELEPTDFGELEEPVPAVAVGSVEVGPELAPLPALPVKEEEESLSDVLDAAFDRTHEAEHPPESVPVKASQDLFQEEEDFFDLAAELEEGFLNVQSAVEEERPQDGQNYSLEEILSDFKKGVEKQLGAEDFDTRYNLGIAYKEMGLIDEAIAEFQIASKDPRRFLECCIMLGLCFVEKGMPKLAVKWYQRGLDTPGYGEEECQGLRYELAQAYEVMGELEKAHEIYQEVYGANASYRNVAKKVKELQNQLNKK